MTFRRNRESETWNLPGMGISIHALIRSCDRAEQLTADKIDGLLYKTTSRNTITQEKDGRMPIQVLALFTSQLFTNIRSHNQTQYLTQCNKNPFKRL